MRILFINNLGGGFADYIDVVPCTTVEQVFAERLPGRRPADYLIRVNRQPVSAGQQLEPDDRLTITPMKIEGARHRRSLTTGICGIQPVRP